MTLTVGGVMSGYCATGSDFMVSRPANTISIASTVANIGRSIKNFENIGPTFYFVMTVFTGIPSRTFSNAEVM